MRRMRIEDYAVIGDTHTLAVGPKQLSARSIQLIQRILLRRFVTPLQSLGLIRAEPIESLGEELVFLLTCVMTDYFHENEKLFCPTFAVNGQQV